MIDLSGYDLSAHIHRYDWGGCQILLDVNSGSVQLLDDMSSRCLDMLATNGGDWNLTRASLGQDFKSDEIDALYSEFQDLYADGQLFSEPDDYVLDTGILKPKAMCLNVAHACNMRCGYCFAGQGAFGHPPALMDLETARQAVDFLLLASGERCSLEVDFFGGEPLLVKDLLFDVMTYARQREKESGKTINFTLTTNALLIDQEIIDWVIDNHIGVIMSLDGRPEINDLNRPLPGGQGSYDRVLPAIQAMVAAGPVSYYVRGTFTRKNLDFASDLQWLFDAGFNCLSLEPAVGEDEEYAIQPHDLPAVLSEYERLTEVLARIRASGQELHFFHYNLDLQKGPCLAKRLSGCGAGLEYIAVTPEGDIYPCHRFIGQADFILGHVSRTMLDTGIQVRFARSQLANKPECLKCWARFYCGGGCHASAYGRNRDLTIPDPVSCAMHKKRIEGAIYLDILDRIR